MKRERPVAVIRRQSSNDGCVRRPVNWVGQALCAVHEWQVFSLHYSTLTNAVAEFFPLRALAERNLKERVGLNAAVRSVAASWTDRSSIPSRDGPFLPLTNWSRCWGRSPHCRLSLQPQNLDRVELTDRGQSSRLNKPPERQLSRIVLFDEAPKCICSWCSRG